MSIDLPGFSMLVWFATQRASTAEARSFHSANPVLLRSAINRKTIRTKVTWKFTQESIRG